MQLVDRKKVITMVRRALNLVDRRLVDHGMKVALVLSDMMMAEGRLDHDTMRKLRLLALFHDIGAYRSEDIDKLLQFETQNIWAHAIYSYLFLRDFFPDDLARIVLYHHANYDVPWEDDSDILHYGQMLHIADRVCVWHDEYTESKEVMADHFEKLRGTVFSPECIDLFWEADRRYETWEELNAEDIFDRFPKQEALPKSEAETYLYILVNAIDFRSRTTVIHTRGVMEIGLELAKLMDMPEKTQRKIYYGALMHDLGKIGTPVSILEKPGRLTPEEMEIMRQHVLLCSEIIGGCADEETVQIALRHHEKLNGQGYPFGLTEKELTMPERLMAVADIASALCMARSYKEAYDKERSLGIIRDMAETGQLDRSIVQVLDDNFDMILQKAAQRVAPIQEQFDQIQIEFKKIMQYCSERSNMTISNCVR